MHRFLSLVVELKKRGFFHLIISNYSVQFIVFGSHLLIAKMMTPSDVGIIKTIEVFTNIAVVLGGGGVIFAILKVVPENNNINIRTEALRFSLKYITLFSFTVFILFNLIAYAGFISKENELVYWFHIYSLLIVPSVIILLLIRYYQAVDSFKRISKIIFYLKLISAIFILYFTYFFYIRGYVISMVITTSVISIALLYDLRKGILGGSLFEDYTTLKKTILKLSKTAFFAQLIDQLKLHSGFLIANYVITDRIMFGHYAFALILIQGLNIILTSVQQFVTPKMSELSNNLTLFFERHKKFENNFSYFAFFIFLLAQLFLPIIVSFIFENKYDDSILLIRIMTVGWLIHSLYALKGIVFLSLGKMKYISFSSLSIFLISFPIMYLLNIKYGILGAALAYVFQNIVSFFIVNFYIKRVSNY